MLQLLSLSFEWAGRPVFENLNFSFGTKKYGLVGRNGVGKSTLAKLIAGELQPENGKLISQASTLYLPQMEKRGEGAFDSLEPAVLSSLAHLGFQSQNLKPARHFKDLSGGEWMRLRLAKILAQPPDLLILDEPTNHLDRPGKRAVIDFIEHFSGTLIIISHDRDVLRHVDEIVELTPQSLVRFGGDFDFFWAERQRLKALQDNEVDFAHRERRKKELKRREEIESQEKRIRRGNQMGAQGGLPKIIQGMKKRQAQITAAKLKTRWDSSVSQAREKLEDVIEGRNPDPFLRLDFKSSSAPGSKVLYSVEDLNLRFAEREASLWPRPISFQMKGQDRWLIKGSNGSGKSSLLDLMRRGFEGRANCRSPEDGVVSLDQEQNILTEEFSVLENVSESTRFNMSELRNELAFYGFTKDRVHQKVETLSGGERLRAALAKMFLGLILPRVILLDEPTNHLDFQSQELLERALQHFEGLLVVASHDERFVENLRITQVLELET